MSDTGKASSVSLCAHLETTNLQLLLAAQGLPSDGQRDELEERLEKELKRRTAGIWVWEKISNLAEPRFGATTVEWNGGVYMYGGFGIDSIPSNKLFKWLPGLPKWTEITPTCANMPPPALYHHSAVVYEGEMWLIGSVGTGCIGQRLPCLAIYNFEKNTLRRVQARGPVPMCIDMCTTFDACLSGNTVIIGSQDGIYQLDLKALEWKLVYESLQATDFWTNYSVSLEDRDLYMFGWSDAHSVKEYVASYNPNELHMYKFNLDSKTWSGITYSGEAPKFRDRYSSLRVHNKWIVHGGTNSIIHGDSSNETYVYNFSTRAWLRLNHGRYQPSKRAHGSCVWFGNERIIFSGGRLDWNGRNQSLCTPCQTVESMKLIDDKASSDEDQNQGLIVMKDTARSIAINPIRRRLHGNKHLSDVTLIIDETEVPAHTLVLAEGSAFFERMWESGMLEGQTRRAHITGVSLEIMEIVLKYLYGCLDMIASDDVLDVFRAADMYEVSGLKTECLNLMLEDMSYTSLVDYWHLGQAFGFKEMCNGCVDFAADNPIAFLKSEAFESYKMSEPALATDLLTIVCARLKHEYCHAESQKKTTKSKIPNFGVVDGIAECTLVQNGCNITVQNKIADEHARLEKMVIDLDASLKH